MGYSSDYANEELTAKGEDCGRSISDYEQMCESFGYSTEEFSELSIKDQSNIRWNWKHIQKRK